VESFLESLSRGQPRLGLAEGKSEAAIIKATDVMIGVE